ncbi:MAG: hypothetical protein JWO88_3746 [Frankiales bacterium]|nr:hypothetical protein [Frankiales bacterium]
MRAPPHGLSQLATSFIACPSLGIPRAPLLRLIRYSHVLSETLTHLLCYYQNCLWCSRPSFSTLPITQIVKKHT